VPRRKSVATREEILARERGTIRKKWRDRLPVALIFPNRYRVGGSNLGFQVVYTLLNGHPDIVCERFFLPPPGSRPLSLESATPLDRFPVLFYSLPFEGDAPNLLAMLAASGIPLRAATREKRSPISVPGAPLVVGGGVVAFMNPEPLAEFTDLFLVGEAESPLPPFLDKLVAQGDKPREEFLLGLVSSEAGWYAPRFYHPEYENAGLLKKIRTEGHVPQRVKKVAEMGGDVAAHSTLFSPDTEFADLFVVELGRGCGRGCRFCTAGFVYRPPRISEAAAVLKALDHRPPDIHRVGLLGMETSSRKVLKEIATRLLQDGCELSFSSLRADGLSQPLLDLLAASGTRTAVLAPDGASERLRKVINKNITAQEVVDAAGLLSRAGITTLKLYVMVGLPTETGEDLAELVELVKGIRSRLIDVGKSRGRMTNITVSASCFVPKPWTPFQFHPVERLTALQNKLQFLKKAFAPVPNVRFAAEQPLTAHFQALVARGDRRFAPLLAELAISGGRFRRHARTLGIDLSFYLDRQRSPDELFPWDVIDTGVSVDYLWREYQRALAAQKTGRCLVGKCDRCGVCEPSEKDGSHH